MNEVVPEKTERLKRLLVPGSRDWYTWSKDKKKEKDNSSQ